MAENDDFHWDGPLPAPDFIMIPKLVHRDILRHLSGAEFKVFYCLLVFAYEWGNPQAELSIAQLVTLAGVGRGTAQAATKRLEDIGLIAVEHHASTVHGHEANTYRVRVTDDPRYVARDPIPKTGIAPPKNWDSFPGGRERSRARSSQVKNRGEERADPGKYKRGVYAVCPECGQRPCTAECGRQTLPA